MSDPNVRFFPRPVVEKFARGADPTTNFVMGELFLHLQQGAKGDPHQVKKLSLRAAQSMLARGADELDQVPVVPAVASGVKIRPSKIHKHGTHPK